MKKYKLHVISNTHWDREWRHPFQRMRMDLVDMMDRLLKICDTVPSFKHYHLDSQTILLEDYLEIRPENRDRLAKHVKSGKVLVGPWYTLPDMNLVSAESIVRNLLIGHKIANGLGRVMKVGYTPTSYGQPSQIAQIYSGFGIESIIFYRGMDAYGVKKWEYILEGADGTQILGIKLGLDQTRFNYRWKVFGGTLRHAPGNLHQIVYHPADGDSFHDGYDMLHTGFEQAYDNGDVVQGIINARDARTEAATTRHLLMMDGFDASYPHVNTARTITDAKKLGATDEVLHQNFPQYIKELRAAVDWKSLQVLKGEQRTPARDTGGTSIMQGVLTSRSYLKRKNHDTQILIEKYLEPTCAFAWMMGLDAASSFQLLAWKYLVSNHGHDTICGPSVDQIYVDAMSRLDQAQMIAHYMTNRKQGEIMEKITRFKPSVKDQVLTVFNTLPFARTEVVEAHIDFPQDDQVKSFALEDYKGHPVPFAVVSKETLYGVAENGDKGYPAYFVDRYTVRLDLAEVPPLGFRSYRVMANGQAPARPAQQVVAAGNTLENEFIKATVNANGTLDIRDKTTGRTFKGLHYFEDGGDAGDPWYYRRPKKDSLVTSLKSKAKVKFTEKTPLSATCRVEVAFDAPRALEPDKIARTRETKPIRCVSYLTLTAHSKYLAIRTEIDTPVEDHRLRAMFPTGVEASHSLAESNFDIARRPIFHNVDTTGWVDPDLTIQPQQSFVDISDGKVGLALLNRGIRAFEAEEDKKRTVGLTLVRGIRYPKVAGKDPGRPTEDDPRQVTCQCKGHFVVDYAIYPHAGDWRKAELYQESRRFNVGMRMGQVSPGVAMKMPEVSFLQIAPKDLVLSALKVAESGKSLIVRFFNPLDREVSGTIRTANELTRARRVNLNEEPQEELELADPHTVKLTVPHKKIVTLELSMKKLK